MNKSALTGILAAVVVILSIVSLYLLMNRRSDPLPTNHLSSEAEKARVEIVAKEGQNVPPAKSNNPPPKPKKVGDPDRFRQNLQQGKTYQVHLKSEVRMKGSEKDWGVKGMYYIDYAFEATIDREILSNDGRKVVEVRHFRSIRNIKLVSTLEDVRLELGDVGEALLPTDWRNFAREISFKPVKEVLDFMKVDTKKLSGLTDKTAALSGKFNTLSGKSVQLTYEDGVGVTDIKRIKGEMTAAEREFHVASVLVSDSLIFPNTTIGLNKSWTVDGSNFSGFFDPDLLARTSGDVELERTNDRIAKKTGENCSAIKVVSGQIRLDDSTDKQGKIGFFEPKPRSSYMLFSPTQEVFVEAVLEGTGQMDRFSKDHLLFEARSVQRPEIKIMYTCKVIDTPKGGDRP